MGCEAAQRPQHSASLRLLEALANRDLGFTPGIGMQGENEDRMHWLSLCLVQELRLRSEGLSRRQRLREIRDGLARIATELTAKSPEGSWAAALVAVSSALLEEPVSLPRAVKQLALASPLVDFDRNLLSEIDALQTLEVDP